MLLLGSSLTGEDYLSGVTFPFPLFLPGKGDGLASVSLSYHGIVVLAKGGGIKTRQRG